jgi:hypothetical protein
LTAKFRARESPKNHNNGSAAKVSVVNTSPSPIPPTSTPKVAKNPTQARLSAIWPNV